MKDEILGNISYQDGAWIRKETIEVYGTNRDITIEIMTDSEESSLEVQKKAYKSYLSKKEMYLTKMPQIFLNEYLYNYEDIKSRIEFSENSPLLRENISEDIIVKTFAPVVILFDKKGNYGWICKCGWTRDKTSAILLSESEPLIITPDQLRNLHTINDNSFGTLIHDGKNYWTTWDELSFYDENLNIRVEVEGSVDEGVNAAQQKVYTQYLQNKSEYLKKLSDAMLPIYLGDKKEAKKIIASGQRVGVKTIIPKHLVIDKKGNFGWICYTEWNKSYIGVLLSEEEIYFMGTSNLREFDQAEKVKDPVFGYLFHEFHGWGKPEIVRFFKKDLDTLHLTIRTYDEDVNNKQRKQYKEYLKYNASFWDGIKDELLAYYLKFYDDFSEYLDIPDSLKKENVTRDNVVSILTFTKLFIDDEGRIAWLCESPTEEEDGLAFEFTEGKIKLIYQPEII